MVVPNSLHNLLASRIEDLPAYELVSFISYRSNPAFTKRLMEGHPELWKRMDYFNRPLKDDIDVDLLATLHRQGLLPETYRLRFVEEVHAAAVEDADDSFLAREEIAAVLTDIERNEILNDVEREVLGRIGFHVDRLRRDWDHDYDPEDHFGNFRSAVNHFVEALRGRIDVVTVKASLNTRIQQALWDMTTEYDPPPATPVPRQQSAAKEDSLDELFRDIDE
jgi:hypothetical protein